MFGGGGSVVFGTSMTTVFGSSVIGAPSPDMISSVVGAPVALVALSTHA